MSESGEAKIRPRVRAMADTRAQQQPLIADEAIGDSRLAAADTRKCRFCTNCQGGRQ